MPRVRPSALVFAMAAVAAALGGGCTFLVTFDEVPAEADAGPPARDAGRDRDVGTPEDAGTEEDAAPPTPVTPACDTTFPLDQVKGCGTFIDNAQVCADNPGITGYPASGERTKDLVTCSKTGATCVRHCVACARNPSGFPDQCDQCMTKANGKYCGTDMGWQPQNFRLLVTCTGGRMSAVTPCGTSCDSKGGTGAAVCK